MINYEKGVTWEVAKSVVLGNKSKAEILKELCFDPQIYEVSNLEPYTRERKRWLNDLPTL